MKYKYPLLLFFLISFNTFSQNYADSLKKKLKNSTDTNRINILNQLSFYYSERDDSISNSYANEAINLSDKLRFFKGKANAMNNKGIIYDVIGNYDSALYYYNNALKIATEINNAGLKANVYNNIGLVFWNKGEYEKALKVYFISLKIYENLKDKKGISKVFSNVGLIYYDLGKLKESLKYHFQSLNIREKQNDDYGIGVSLTNIGLTYEEMDSLNLALNYYLESIKLKIKTNDLYGLAIVYNNIGTTYYAQGKMDDALKYHLLALPIREKINDEYGLITTCNNLAELYRWKHDLKLSLVYSLKALGIAEILESKTKLKMVYKFLHIYYKEIGDYKNSLFYFEKYDLVKDSIYTSESSRNMSEMQAKYETEKKEQQLKLKSVEVEKQKYRNKIQILLFSAIAIFIIIISGFIIYRNKQRQKAELINENNRQEKLRFKSIIDSEEKERIRIAKELHDGLGQLLSSAKLNMSGLEDGIQKEDEQLLKNSLTIIDDAVKEVRNISHNMMPTALMNYGIIEAINGFVTKINDTKQIAIKFDYEGLNISLEKELEIAIFRIVQEIINNMLKHSSAKNIDMLFFNEEDKLKMLIKDNGKGFDVTEIDKSTGIGWQNIYSRVLLLNGKILVNSQIGMGTEISITIKV